MSPSDGDDGNRGEARLRDYLAELKKDPPESDPRLTGRVTRRARWQHAARGPLQAIGLLLGAVADGLSDLLGADRGSRR